MKDDKMVPTSTKNSTVGAQFGNIQKNYRHPIENSIQRDGPWEREESGVIECDQNGIRIINKDRLVAKCKTKRCNKQIWTDLLEFDRKVLEQYRSSEQSATKSRTESNDTRSAKPRSALQYRNDLLNMRGRMQAAQRGIGEDRDASRYRVEMSSNMCAVHCQSEMGLHAIVNAFVKKNGGKLLFVPTAQRLLCSKIYHHWIPLCGDKIFKKPKRD